MKSIHYSMLAAMMLVASHVTLANDKDPVVDVRQEKQAQRIIQGVASGELTARETRNLVRQQRHINQLERAFKSDGQLTAIERQRLQRAQDRASRNIAIQKHDAQRR